MRLAGLIALIVLITHYGYEPLGEFYDDPSAAARRIFYAMRGLEGVVLFAIIAAFAVPFGRSRNAKIAIATACAWGALEEGQTAVCRAIKGFDANVASSRYSGLCDSITGIPFYLITAVVALLVAMFVHERLWR